ncbi:MAG TPA: glycosyl transferase family 1, partial [Novosphingobium sp.]|nr:glycosyl transferase family 1 [Novosphingobium sp.]
VVSTPYVHARELLADGVGALIEPGDPAAIAGAVNALLDDPSALLAMQMRAYERGRRTIWPQFAKASARLIRASVAPAARTVSPLAIPGLSAVRSMSDATGMYQHSIGIVPDRRHGYCLDDNVRALMLINVASGMTEAERTRWSTVYAGFIHYAWNPDRGRFRNFMNFDRTWCESEGSEDSNGRTLWALGHTVERSRLPDMATWAMMLYDEVAETVGSIGSPRALAFATLGALAMMRAGASHSASLGTVHRTCDMLAAMLEQNRQPGWTWFEPVLAYDNPRLCQALIEGGQALDRPDWVAAGVEALTWLSGVQSGQHGHFRAVGSETFGLPHDWRPFDQQPLEAQAAIEAACAAWTATGEARWIELAHQAYQWFFGANERGVVLADLASGRCRDGITPRGRNENSGAESILAFQLGHYALADMLRATQPQGMTGNRLGHSTDHDRTQSSAHS